MAIADYLNKEGYVKIVIVKMTYIDIGGVQRTKFFSDKVVSVPIDLDVSTTKITPDPNIQSIPQFRREFKPIENEVVRKSSYALNIFNQENEYDDFFIDNVFTNQKIEFYVTAGTELYEDRIDLLDPFEAKKIAEGVIVEVSDIGERITLKIEESNVYEKSTTYTFENFSEGVSEDTKKQKKYAIGGALYNFKLTNINQCDDSKWWDFGVYAYVTGTYGIATENPYMIIKIPNAEQASFFRNAMVIGNKISFEAYGEDEDGNRHSHDLIRSAAGALDEFQFTGLPFIENPGTLRKILIKADSGASINNKFFVSANKTKSKVTSKLTGAVTARAITMTLDENWYFLKAGDILLLEDLTLTNPLVTGNDYDARFYPVKLAAYNRTTKVATLEARYCIPTFIATAYAANANNVNVHYNYIRKLRVKDTNLTRDHHYSLIKCGGFDSIKQVSSKARIEISNFGLTGPDGIISGISGNSHIQFIADAAGEAPNKDSIRIVEDWPAASPTPCNITRHTNSAGGYCWVVHIKEYRAAYFSFPISYSTVGTTLAQIKAAFQAWTTWPVPSFKNTINIIGGTDPDWQYQKDGSQELYLQGGTSYNTNIQWAGLLDPKSSTSTTKKLDLYQRFCIHLQKNGSGTGPSLPYYITDSINVTTGETGAQVAVKLKNKINSYFPLFSSMYAEIHPTLADTIILRKTVECNVPNQAYWFAGNSGFTSENFDHYKLFEDVISNQEHTINLNYIGLSLSLPKYALAKTTINIDFSDVNDYVPMLRRSAVTNVDANFDPPMCVLQGLWENYVVTQSLTPKTVTEVTAGEDNTSTFIFLKDTSMFSVGDFVRVGASHYSTINGMGRNQFVVISTAYPSGNIPNGTSIKILSHIVLTQILFSEVNETVSYEDDKYNFVRKPLELKIEEKLYIDYVDENVSVGYLIKDILDNFYDIDSYVADDFDFFVDDATLRDKLWGYYKITDGDQMYKNINPILQSFNIACFTDQDGKIRFKFLDPYSIDEVDASLFHQDFIGAEKSMGDHTAQKVRFQYAEDFSKDENKFKEYIQEDELLTNLLPLTKFNAEKEVPTVIALNIFEDTYLGATFADLFSKKYFVKNQTLVITAPITFINDELYKVYSFINHPRINPTDQWRLHKIETNLSTMKLTMIRLIPRPDFSSKFIVDADGDILIDEVDTEITYKD